MKIHLHQKGGENPGESIVVVAYDRDASISPKEGKNVNEIWTFDIKSSTWTSEPEVPKRNLEDVLKEISEQ
ncbi:MAG: hypothetical protein QGG82_00725 [Patescibacteria group bacterium]|nr:hypothetical protein [Patescibacteria group bacterium]